MSTDDRFDPGSIATVDDLQRALRSLASRVDELEAELAVERERREALENLVDVRTPPERDTPWLEDLFIADLPVGRILKGKASANDLDDLQDRVDRAFGDGVQSEATPEQSLPIMQVTRTWRSEPRSLNDTQRRAAMVWSDFFDFCKTSQTKHVLYSNEVKKILAAHEENTHRQTRKDVMELVAELGRQYILLERVKGRNALVIERTPWEEYVAELAEEVRP